MMRKPSAGVADHQARELQSTAATTTTTKFGEDEDDLIIKLHALLGNRWSLIAGRLPGRREKEVKKHWNKHLKRKLLRMGIDPDNHGTANLAGCFLPPTPATTSSSRRNRSTKTPMTTNAPTAPSMPHHLHDLNLDLTIAPPTTITTTTTTAEL